MCKACKMDPSEMDTMYRRQGMVDVDDFEKVVNYAPKKKKEKKRTRRRPGCVANNNKQHVLVWTQEYEDEKSLFFRYFGFHEYERLVCCGCGYSRKSRNTERYEKRKENIWKKMESAPPNTRRRRGQTYRYFCWEYKDEGYMAFRKDYIAKRGWDSAVYGRLYSVADLFD